MTISELVRYALDSPLADTLALTPMTNAESMTSEENFSRQLIQLIDEIMRGHGRLVELAETFSAPGDPIGLERTVLTSVVNAPIPPTVPQIGRSLGYPRQTIQRQADKLVQEGHLGWSENPHHKKARCLTSTITGQRAHQRAEANSQHWAKQFASEMAGAELEKTIATLVRFRKALEAEARARI